MIAANASTVFSRASRPAAITLTFFTYAFVNMGMVTGNPAGVGVPLPMVSSAARRCCRSCRGSGY
jgi:rod shape determining protein RodA